MKTGIHPKYKKFKIIISKDVFETNSGGHAEEILMDVDYRKHPAWTKESGNVVNQSNKNISDFNKKFAGLSFGKKSIARLFTQGGCHPKRGGGFVKTKF